MITIAVDAMSGDHGHEIIVPAVLKVMRRHNDFKVILVGDSELLTKALENLADGIKNRLEVKHASQIVAMDEDPRLALRNKKDSSIRVMLNLVKEGQAQACVSAGNTGALMATARFVLKMIPGIDRPAIITALPTHKGKVYILDLGANVDCDPEHLMQFAVMGSVLVEVLEDNPSPRIALLNNGREEIKGNELVKMASKMISEQADINYVGFVEGDGMFSGDADVIVCDGFVGNVALKTIEGVVKLIAHFMKVTFKSSIFSRLFLFLASGAFKRLKKTIDPAHYNGASLLGLQGIVVKSHGNANIKGFANAILYAKREAEAKFIERLSLRVGQIIK